MTKLSASPISLAKRTTFRWEIIAALGAALLLSGCSTTTLPWPSLSISKDDADEALTKEEQSLLADLLASSEKNHKQQAVDEIENR